MKYVVLNYRPKVTINTIELIIGLEFETLLHFLWKRQHESTLFHVYEEKQQHTFPINVLDMNIMQNMDTFQ